MSSYPADTFLNLAVRGEVLLEEIDEFIDQWHEGQNSESISAFLGMTPEEYALWATEPDMLPYIVRARHEGKALPNVVNDNFKALRIAARASDASKVARLGRWLKQNGYID